MKTYTIHDLAQLIDHTNLNPDASHKDMIKLCNEAIQYQFKMVAVNQVQSEICASILTNSAIHVGAAISFPLGQSSIEVKLFEAEDAIKKGVSEIDYVINITELKEQNADYLKSEMEQMVMLCRNHNVVSKVIFENCYLSTEEIISMCEIAREVQPDFIKTSTGFGTSGATAEDVRLMKNIVGPKVKVKAAGGIRDADTFISMIQNGAERIGCSAGISIMEELKKRISHSGKQTIDI